MPRSCKLHASWESQGYWGSHGFGSQPHEDESRGDYGKLSKHPNHLISPGLIQSQDHVDKKGNPKILTRRLHSSYVTFDSKDLRLTIHRMRIPINRPKMRLENYHRVGSIRCRSHRRIDID